MNLFNWDNQSIQENTLSGLRLHRLEMYNWGTFDKTIWTYEPNGETSLLTGDSGSGKSTLVDALTTLLVSPKKIAYNKAADASAKERTLASYVQGVYGQKSALEGKRKTEALRGTGHFSVILGIFKDEVQDKTITLGNFFWFKDQAPTPNRFYIVSPKELFISKDFKNIASSVKELKTRLKLDGAQIFESYKEYDECFRHEFGRIKPQAINLFQQTISMKKVEVLTEFVRDNMLEDTGVEDEIEKLLNHFHDLNYAHEAVVRARRQIEMLTPIYNNGAKRTVFKADLATTKSAQETLSYWFALIKDKLFEARAAELTKALSEAKTECEDNEAALAELNREISRIEKEIWQNGGQALENLEAELISNQNMLHRRTTNFESYKEFAIKAKFTIPKNISEFRENTINIPTLVDSFEENVQLEESESKEVYSCLKETKNECCNLENEIVSLRERESNIPGQLIRLRAELCADLKIEQSDVPFAGELIEVKESESDWEGALERLMHSFALSLIVSEKLYESVSRWVNQKHLGTRLVYLHTKMAEKAEQSISSNTNIVANKVCFKEDSPFFSWLSNEVNRQFNHICCEEMSVFQQSSKAITKSGLIKSKQRHEKDDRNQILDRTRYVLGFSSRKKIAALTEQLNKLYEKKQSEEAAMTAYEARLSENKKIISALSSLAAFKDYDDIDIVTVQHAIDDCKSQIDQIRSSDSGLNMLKMRQNDKMEQQKRQNEKNNKSVAKNATLAQRLDDLNQQKTRNDEALFPQAASSQSICEFLENHKQKFIGDVVITLDNSDKCEKSYRVKLQSEIDAFQQSIVALNSKIEKNMKEFMLAFPNDSKELLDSMEYLDEYTKLLEHLNQDGLPRFEADFKELLRSKMLQQISLFHMTLRTHYENIKKRIEDINMSMHDIDYNKGRYIKLREIDSPDSEIKEFRIRLKSCTEGTTGGIDGDELSERKFIEVKEILSRFQGREKESELDKRWTKKVTDVRNWFLFAASEHFRETDEEYAFYPDSGGKSGGQKEKLAYTILAASLVYNYGLNEEYLTKTSFRLVAIDEAFLKSSDDSAKYGLELFKKLDFQLVVVTPLLKISTIEPFIAHVGFVSHDDLTHKSSIMNITIDEYHKNRKKRDALNAVKVDTK